MSTHVVILGAGFGGLELSSRLDDALADQVQVTLIDQNDSFVFGFSKLDVMYGRQRLDQVQIHYRDIAKPSVDFRQETVVSIDPVTRRVVTDGGSYDADILVVALGADLDPGATPGLTEGGYEFYSPEGADRVREVLPTFDSGVAVISVLGPFFKCPPAPYEAAFLLHDFLERRGVREATSIYLLSSLGSPIPISKETSAAIVSMLDEKGIEFWPSSVVERLDPGARVAHLGDGRQLAYDLFLGIPVHRAPQVVVEAGLTDDGWIGVDPATFADAISRRVRRRGRHQRAGASGRDHRRGRGPHRGRRPDLAADRGPATGTVRGTGHLLHRDGPRRSGAGRRQLPRRRGPHGRLQPAVPGAGRGETAVRLVPPGALVRLAARAAPSRPCGRPAGVGSRPVG